MTDDLSQRLDFIRELDKLKAVYRQTAVAADQGRQENSAEHSWHISLMAQTLAPYANAPIDIARVTAMLLIHDVVEIDTGDVMAFSAQEALEAQAEKEQRAAERLFGLLPEATAQPWLALWREFEAAASDDAQFAKAMDRLLPLIQNMQQRGGSWPRFKVTRAQVLKRNQYLQRSAPKLWDYVQAQVEIAVGEGWVLEDA